ncbi:class I SAM-dependent methyltransferase [Leisingera caerulea]|uniref:Class I SAM-dependent methyltransferase n=1 Tax=Leisingera caerulea TaxID=506591 RepID=A0ABY5WTY1_LEICA|nr:class I SAM-dependent methyltransferase [Leisingera caerulea]UWQ57626.1 class I SAM-dependent methyltransferase [Leisingera caerulea]
MSDYYNRNAESFIKATQTVDMTAIRNRFLAALPQGASGDTRLLDAGTGSGRDARAFRLAGFRVEAFDASPAMVRAATAFAAIPVRQMCFEKFEWEHPFVGIWACASLLHVAQCDLPSAMQRLADHLVFDGILYVSFKFGTGERNKDGRHFTDMTEETLSAVLDECPSLRQVDIWRSQDRRTDKKNDIWLNALLRKE